jgi:trehalose 6-phosphate phosphatase
VPDEEAAQEAIEALAREAEAAGFISHWGRKVLEIRPPVRIDKGAGIVGLLRDTPLAAAVYVGDDMTDLDAYRGLSELQELGTLDYALRVAVGSGEAPAELTAQADLLVDGTDGVKQLLSALLAP